MEFRNLGRTGVKVSVLCLGTMMFGEHTSEDDSMDIIDSAIDKGINFLDTANIYPGPGILPSRGRSEEIVGKALKRNRKRSRMVLATKVFFPMADDDPNARGGHRRHIIEECDASLRRLQTDYIDLYYIHRPSSDIPIDETLRALDDLIHAGKVRYIGSSTFAAWQIVDSLWAAKELGTNRFVCEQPPYNLLDRRIERELVPMAQTYGLAIVTWSPLAGGFLTGKYHRDNAPSKETRIGRGNWSVDPHFSDSAFNVSEVIKAISQKKGCTPSQFAIAWCTRQTGITSPIIGPRNMEQLEDNLQAVNVEVTDEDRVQINAVSYPGGVIVPYYEADFGPHRFRW